MKNVTRLISSAVLLTSACFVSSAFACNTAAWEGGVADAVAGDPVVEKIARVSGFCGMQVTATNGYVADNNPTDETTFISRFYFFPKNVAAGPHEIFVALSDEANSESDVFVISYNSGDITVDAQGAGGDSVTVAADPTHWNLVEVSWTSGGTGEIWVNSDATVDAATDTFAPGTGSIGRVEMGGADAGLFDDYESHRSLPVGALLVGDSNNDGMVNGLDISGVLKEANAFSPELQSGTPDCNLDGSVSGLDISGILKAADAFNPVLCASGT